MTRKLCAMTLALAFVGGVYLTAEPAAASNMGFKLEREFAPVDQTGFRNLFYVSFPLFNGLGDIADTSQTNACTGTGDGVINADDAMCDLWSDQRGEFTLSRYDIDSCAFQSRSVTIGFGGDPLFSGLWTSPLPRDEGLQVEQTVPAMGGPVQNQAVIVGSHDPSYAGRVLAPNTTTPCRGDQQVAFINLPYHTMYELAAEIACGLRGIDWELDMATNMPIWLDLDSSGTVEPDEQCPGGVFDGTTNLTVRWYDNVDDNSGPAGRDTDGLDVACSIQSSFGNVQFVGDCTFDLVPGEAYVVEMLPSHSPTTFLSPHF